MKTNHPLRRAAWLALMISLLLLVIKFIAYFLTNSKAVLSDALESIINVVTGAFLLFTINVSIQPIDENHPYGHGKIEAFSAGLEGGLIILAAITIIIEAVPAFFTPRPPENIGFGGIMLFGAGIINLLVGVYLLRSGKKHKSEALTADGRHLLADFYTSAGVIIGLLLVHLSGWSWLDPLVACLVAINILLPGLRLLQNAVKNLMNEADPALLDRIVTAFNEIKKPGWLYPHKLRALRSGRYHHIDLHIILPRYWPLSKIHAAEDEINAALLSAIGEEGDIMIHTDPCEPADCGCCNLTPCRERTSRFNGAEKYSIEKAVAARPAKKRLAAGHRI